MTTRWRSFTTKQISLGRALTLVTAQHGWKVSTCTIEVLFLSTIFEAFSFKCYIIFLILYIPIVTYLIVLFTPLYSFYYWCS